jgi:hypothetical protein
MDVIFEVLRIAVALAILGGLVHYWLTTGPPPRGKGRWRTTLNALSDRPKRKERKP